METALVLPVPEAEAIVADWRLKFDASAALGMPAHVTILFPFMPFAEIQNETLSTLKAVFSSHVAFDIMFKDVKRFPNSNTLWLAPHQPAPLVALTKTLQHTFPDYQMYGGAFPEIIPHLTVAQCDSELLDGIEKNLRKKLVQPIRTYADKVELFAHQAGRWVARHEFPLKSKT